MGKSRQGNLFDALESWNSQLATGVKMLQKDKTPFSSSDEMLEVAHEILTIRGKIENPSRQDGENIDSILPELKDQEKELTNLWHSRIKLSVNTVKLCKTIKKHKLNNLESEVIAICILNALGLWDNRISDISQILSTLAIPTSQKLMALRYMSENGRLYKEDLIYYDDVDEKLSDRTLIIAPELIDMALNGNNSVPPGFGVTSEAALYDELEKLSNIMLEKTDTHYGGYARHSKQEFERLSRKLKSLIRKLDETLTLRPKWHLSKLRLDIKDYCDWVIFLALLGKSLEHGDEDSNLYKGRGLSTCASQTKGKRKEMVKRLMSNAPLVKNNLVAPCNGSDFLLGNNTNSSMETEFELTDNAITLLGIDDQVCLGKKTDTRLKTPQISLSNIVLPPETAEAVNLAIVQSKGRKTLMSDWGLGETFSYGKGLTMLFNGSPGTGKTATAEAIAHELKRPLLVADYSKIQGCYVGQTEKNIVSTFRAAQKHNAVLFWDEADAMFFDRDSASQNWEVRDVNVLLQEIERFEGVCILATNRKGTMDKALERRIAVKVEFPRPDKAIRNKLWRKLLPKKLPLSKDIDFDNLSSFDMSGGEIKNVVLNASRFAFVRSVTGPVTMADFLKAIDLENDGNWSSKKSMKTIGFVN